MKLFALEFSFMSKLSQVVSTAVVRVLSFRLPHCNHVQPEELYNDVKQGKSNQKTLKLSLFTLFIVIFINYCNLEKLTTFYLPQQYLLLVTQPLQIAKDGFGFSLIVVSPGR